MLFLSAAPAAVTESAGRRGLTQVAAAARAGEAVPALTANTSMTASSLRPRQFRRTCLALVIAILDSACIVA